MTNDIHQPTPSEIHAYELKAHQLRAEATREGVKVIAASVKSIAHRVVEVFTRPAHA